MARWYMRVLFVAILALGTRAVAQPPGDDHRFDGTWIVSLLCGPTPDGALGFTSVFPATVRDSHLHGQYHTLGHAPSLTYDGQIHPDGSAIIAADGLTGNPRESVKGVQRGYPVHYHFRAQFSGAHGFGKRTEIRPCDIDFERQ